MNYYTATIILMTSSLILTSLPSYATSASAKKSDSKDVTDYLPFLIDTIVSEFSDSKSIAYEDLRNSSFYTKNLNFIQRRLEKFQPKTLNVVERKCFFISCFCFMVSYLRPAMYSNYDRDRPAKLATTALRARARLTSTRGKTHLFYFIDTYNLLMIDSITKMFPDVGNISHIERNHSYVIGHSEYTLAAIKHGVLRGNSRDVITDQVYFDDVRRKEISVRKDSRVFSVLFRPFETGPFLQAYTKDDLGQKLDLAMVRMCEDGVQLEDGASIVINSVFKTFMTDFAPTEEKLLRWLSDCVTDSNKKVALYFASLDDDFLSYSFQRKEDKIAVWKRQENDKKLDVDLYIESLCSDVKTFFETQLQPSFESIKNIVNLNIIVFGKASVLPIDKGEDFKFECQNGAEECQGNKIMSCAVEYLPKDRQVPFLTCLLTSPSLSKGVKECGIKNGVPTSAIEECSNSLEGSRILYDNGIKTLALQPKIYFIPTITVDKAYNDTTLEQAMKHFSRFICMNYINAYESEFGISTPSGCRVKVDVYVDSLNPDVDAFLSKQLIPTWRRVGDSIDLDIIPYGQTVIDDTEKNKDDVISKMKCRRGPLECYGNIAMSCLVDLFSLETQIELLECMVTKKSSSLKVKECSNEVGVDWQPMDKCIEGSRGTQLILQNQRKTEALKPPLESVPTITVNKIHNKTFTEWALHDLTALVCDAFLISNQLQGWVDLPKGCPVRIEIYFETHCPDTRRFFLKSFYPVWKKLRPLIDLHLIPFGKANVWLDEGGTGYEFECQHGPLECKGNKLLSCVVEYLPIDLQVEFAICMFQSKSPASAGNECSKKLLLAWEPLRACTSSNEGSVLLFQNGIRTMNLKPTLYFVPTITINRYYDPESLSISLHKIEDQICHAYQKPFKRTAKVLTPKGCKLKVEVYFISFTKESNKFILHQVMSVWKKLQSQIDLELIPIGKLPDFYQNESDFEESCRKSRSCSADMAFACVTKHFDIDQQIQLLECSLQSNESLAFSKSCVKSRKHSWGKVAECLRQSDGVSILKKNLFRARNLRPSFHKVPTIVINGFYDKKELEKSSTNLEQYVCESFYDPVTSKPWKPKTCPVTLEIFIASLCPDTKRFFLHQLQPMWQKLKSIVDIKIVPFGKASAKLINADTGDYEFKCQHGPLECYGNQVISCIVKHYSIEDQMRILPCMFTRAYSAIEGRECADEHDLNWNVIIKCIDSEGASLLYQNGLKTQRITPKIFFIPTTTVNGIYNKMIGRRSLQNLSGLVCSTYLNKMNKEEPLPPIPEGCKVDVQVYFRHLNDGMKRFFSEVAEEFWRDFKTIAHLSFRQLKYIPIHDSHKDCSEKACFTEKFLACFAERETVDTQMDFIACLMSQEYPEHNLKKCSKELAIDFDEVDSCVWSSKSSRILEDNKENFLKFQSVDHKLPLISVGKTILKDHKELKNLTCQRFHGPKPQKC